MKCRFCQNYFKTQKKFKVDDKFSYVECPNCKGAYLKPFEIPKKLYQSKQYFTDLSKSAGNLLLQKTYSLRMFQLPSEWVNNNFGIGRILDVGCGNGEFLQKLKNKAWDTWGSDISKVAVSKTASKIGKEKVRRGEFSKLNFRKERFDLISFWHVLEHVKNPYGYLDKAYKLLEKGGSVVGEVPNYDSFVLKIFKANYSWLMLPEHILYFSNKSLYEVLRRAGFKEIEIFSPPRALLNFSLSLKKHLGSKMLFFVSIPFSMLFVWLASLFKRGEILRFKARK